MEKWKFITAMVVVLVFALEIRPLDPFITAYLTEPGTKVTLEEVSNVLMPIQLYVSVLGTLLVFLLTDYLKYKPVIVLNGLLGMATYWCFAGSPSLLQIAVAMSCKGLFICAEVVCCCYLFAKIEDEKYFQVAMGCVKAGMLSGQCVSGLIGQLIVYLNGGHDYSTLSYYSFAGMTFAFGWACLLPPVQKSLYFHLNDTAFSKGTIRDPNIPKYTADDDVQSLKNAITITSHVNPFRRIYNDFLQSYANPTVRKWSFWHSLSITAYSLITLNINVLYSYVADESAYQNELLNGIVNSFSTICGAICSYNVSKMDVNWNRHSNAFLVIGSLALGLIVCLCAYSTHIVFVYAIFVSYSTLVQSMFVICITQIVKELKKDCYALVFGFNAFVAISLASCWALFLVQVIKISIPLQFLFYGGIYIALAVTYICASLFQNKTVNFKRLP